MSPKVMTAGIMREMEVLIRVMVVLRMAVGTIVDSESIVTKATIVWKG